MKNEPTVIICETKSEYEKFMQMIAGNNEYTEEELKQLAETRERLHKAKEDWWKKLI